MIDSKERDRGILSPDDREFLRGEKELTEGAEYNAKRRIRERVYNGLLDFSLLVDYLEEDERNELFRIGEEPPEELEKALADTFAFLFLGTMSKQSASAAAINEEKGYEHTTFQHLLEEGLKTANLEFGIDFQSLETTITANRVSDVARIKQKMNEGKSISADEIQILLKSEEVDTELVQNVIREELG